MKKYLIGIFIVLLIIFASGCIIDSGDDSNSTSVQTATKNGVMVMYPDSWVLSQSTSNNSLIALADPNHLYNGDVAQATINIEKKSFDGDFNSFLNTTYTSMVKDGSYNLSSTGNITVNGESAYVYYYSSDINGTEKMHEAVWMEHGNDAYVILCSAPESLFKNSQPVFDFVINHFKITS